MAATKTSAVTVLAEKLLRQLQSQRAAAPPAYPLPLRRAKQRSYGLRSVEIRG